MDPAKVFVLILTAVAVGALVYLEIRSRHTKE
jgi:hypothetical protein